MTPEEQITKLKEENEALKDLFLIYYCHPDRYNIGYVSIPEHLEDIWFEVVHTYRINEKNETKIWNQYML